MTRTATAAEVHAEGRRTWGADTAWSDPGESFGTPDRYQSRVYRGAHLGAGSNHRDGRGRHLRADAPWWVAVALPFGAYQLGAPGAKLPTVASGACATQEAARAAAEAAADAYFAALAAPAPSEPAVYEERCLDCETAPCSCADVGDLEERFDRALAAGGAS